MLTQSQITNFLKDCPNGTIKDILIFYDMYVRKKIIAPVTALSKKNHILDIKTGIVYASMKLAAAGSKVKYFKIRNDVANTFEKGPIKPRFKQLPY